MREVEFILASAEQRTFIEHLFECGYLVVPALRYDTPQAPIVRDCDALLAMHHSDRIAGPYALFNTRWLEPGVVLNEISRAEGTRYYVAQRFGRPHLSLCLSRTLDGDGSPPMITSGGIGVYSSYFQPLQPEPWIQASGSPDLLTDEIVAPPWLRGAFAEIVNWLTARSRRVMLDGVRRSFRIGREAFAEIRQGRARTQYTLARPAD